MYVYTHACGRRGHEFNGESGGLYGGIWREEVEEGTDVKRGKSLHPPFPLLLAVIPKPCWRMLQCQPVSFLNGLSCTSAPKFWGGENSAHKKDEIGIKGHTQNHLPACLMQLRAPDRPYGPQRARQNLKKVWVWYLGRTRPTVTNFMAFLICVCMNICGGRRRICVCWERISPKIQMKKASSVMRGALHNQLWKQREGSRCLHCNPQPQEGLPNVLNSQRGLCTHTTLPTHPPLSVIPCSHGCVQKQMHPSNFFFRFP